VFPLNLSSVSFPGTPRSATQWAKLSWLSFKYICPLALLEYSRPNLLSILMVINHHAMCLLGDYETSVYSTHLLEVRLRGVQDAQAANPVSGTDSSAVQVTLCTAHQFSNVLNLTFEEVMLLNSFPIPWLLVETILKNVCLCLSVCLCSCAPLWLSQENLFSTKKIM
ncbi:sterile alpha motif domain containing 10, isoform CRA_a, partial [Mus musculus]